MSREGRRWLGTAGAAVLVVVFVIAFAGWWTLLWVPLALLLAGVITAIWRSPNDDPEPRVFDFSEPDPEPLREEPLPPGRLPITQVALPSARPDYAFLFSAVVRYTAPPSHEPGIEGSAADMILVRARALARTEDPEECAAVRYRLAWALGSALRHEEEDITAWAEEIRVELAEEDAERLRRVRGLRKDEELREQEREAERRRRDYLAEDVLADPGQAVLWWLARDPEQIKEADRNIGVLARLSAASTGSEIPSLYRRLIGEKAAVWEEAEAEPGPVPPPGEPEEEPDPLVPLCAIVDALAADDDGRETVVDRLARLAGDIGRTGLAERLREHYAVPDVLADDAGASEAAEGGPSSAAGAGDGGEDGAEPSAQETQEEGFSGAGAAAPVFAAGNGAARPPEDGPGRL